MGKDIQGDGFTMKTPKKDQGPGVWLIILTLLVWTLWCTMYLFFLRPPINKAIFGTGIQSFPAALHVFAMLLIPAGITIGISKLIVIFKSNRKKC